MAIELTPFEYLHLSGVPEWTDERERMSASQLEAIEAMVPTEMVHNAIAHFIADVLRCLIAPQNFKSRSTGPYETIGTYMNLQNTARRRVIMCQIQLGKLDGTAIIPFDRDTWEEFIEVESGRATKQIVRLWLDLLSVARICVHPLDDLILNDNLLPTHDVDHGLRAVPGGDWADQFHELISWNCCILPADIGGILLKFIERVTNQLENVRWWSLNLLSEQNNILRLIMTQRGQIVVPTGHPEDLDEHTMPRPLSWPERQLPHAWVIKRLDALADEAKRSLNPDGSESAALFLVRDRAMALLEQLKETAVPRSAEGLVASMLVKGGTTLYPSYDGRWLETQLNTIFPDDLP